MTKVDVLIKWLNMSLKGWLHEVSWLAFNSFVARSETLLYVKFQPGLEVSWLGINPAGAKFLEMVPVYVNINKNGYIGR